MPSKKSRNYRGYKYPLPIDGYDLIDVCFQIPDNPYYRAAVRGALHQLTQYYSWWNEQSGADLQERWNVGKIFLNLLNDTLSIGEGCAMQLQVRTNPDNACILEYSPDGGEEWYQFADVTQCPDLGGDSYTTTVQLNSSQTTIYETIYDGTPGSINPNAPTLTWDEGGDPDRDAALCMAAMSIVGSICAQELQALIERYIGSALIFAALFILTGGFAAFGVLVVGSLIAGVSFEAARAALEDREAQLAVACCMFDGLKSEPVTQPAFAASLDSCGFTPGTNEMIVRDFVHRSIQADTTYYAMIDSAGKAYIQQVITKINLCECGECGIITFDLPLSDLPYLLVFGTVGPGGNPAQCLQGEFYAEPPTYPHGLQAEILVELPAESTVTKVNWDRYAFVAIHPSGGTIFRAVTYYNSEMVQQDFEGEEIFANPEWEKDTIEKTVADVKFIRIREYYSCNCPDEKYLSIDNVRVFCY